MRPVSDPRSVRMPTWVVKRPRTAVIRRCISIREPRSIWPKPADIVGLRPWNTYALERGHQTRATPIRYAAAIARSAREAGASRRIARPRDANAVEGMGTLVKRIGKSGRTMPRAGIREKPNSRTVRRRTGTFGYRTRRTTRTWDVRRTRAE